ncbi:MAG: oxidoreductase, partial [Dehalococcoidia bacterium]
GILDEFRDWSSTLLTRMQQWSSIALSGLAGGVPIATTVMPFILRGVNLLGIDSVQLPMADRQRIWARCGSDLKPRGLLDSIASEVDLDGLAPVLADIIPGKVRGRVLVRVS